MDEKLTKQIEEHLREEKLFRAAVIEFIDHTKKNFAQVFLDRENDNKLMGDIYKAVGLSASEAHLLVGKVEEAKDTVKQESKEAKKSIQTGVEKIEENLIGKTKIIEKKIVHFSFLDWIKSFRKKEVK